VKDEVENEGFVRSQWRDPADPNTSLSIDTGEEETPPESKAETVRADTRQDPAYQELSFAPRLISGMTGQKWMFRLGDDQRVDYFVNDCGVGLAVLGSTSAVRFAALEDTFSQHEVLARCSVTVATRRFHRQATMRHQSGCWVRISPRTGLSSGAQIRSAGN